MSFAATTETTAIRRDSPLRFTIVTDASMPSPWTAETIPIASEKGCSLSSST